MAKNKRNNDLFDHLRAHGVRKRVAKALSSRGSGANGRRKAEALARTAIADLCSASEAIRDRVMPDTKRTEAAKKAARTRKRNAAKRSAAAKKGAATRKGAKSRGR
jgi:hypothetical protein